MVEERKFSSEWLEGINIFDDAENEVRSHSSDVTHNKNVYTKSTNNLPPTAFWQNGAGSKKGGNRMEQKTISNFLRSHLSKLMHSATDYYYLRLCYSRHCNKGQHYSKIENEMTIFHLIHTHIHTPDSHYTWTFEKILWP